MSNSLINSNLKNPKNSAPVRVNYTTILPSNKFTFQSSSTHPEFAPIPEKNLPLCRPFQIEESKKDGHRQEPERPVPPYQPGAPYQLWNPQWNAHIGPDGFAFLEEAACLGYTEDQSLAVLYVCKFDVPMARDRLPKFRNIYIPVWTESDKQTFEDLLNIHGKSFSRFRQRLRHISMKEIVNYYYYQKQVKKKASSCSAVLTRRALALARRRLTKDYLTNQPAIQMSLSSDQRITCGVCFKLSNKVFRIGEEHDMCTECYSHYCNHKTLPPKPADDFFSKTLASHDFATVGSLTHCLGSVRSGIPGIITVSESITAPEQESCAVMVKAKTVGLLREHRREIQLLAKSKECSPTAQQHSQLMNQIRGVLTDDNGHGRNVLAVIDLDR